MYEPDARGLIVACPSCSQKNRLAYDRLSERVRCARCKTDIPVPASPIDVRDSADFDRLVASASVPVIVDYWAPWCGPCRMVAPELQKVAARQAGKALVVKVNTDELSDLGRAIRHSVDSDDGGLRRRQGSGENLRGASGRRHRGISRAVGRDDSVTLAKHQAVSATFPPPTRCTSVSDTTLTPL